MKKIDTLETKVKVLETELVELKKELDKKNQPEDYSHYDPGIDWKATNRNFEEAGYILMGTLFVFLFMVGILSKPNPNPFYQGIYREMKSAYTEVLESPELDNEKNMETIFELEDKISDYPKKSIGMWLFYDTAKDGLKNLRYAISKFEGGDAKSGQWHLKVVKSNLDWLESRLGILPDNNIGE